MARRCSRSPALLLHSSDLGSTGSATRSRQAFGSRRLRQPPGNETCTILPSIPTKRWWELKVVSPTFAPLELDPSGAGTLEPLTAASPDLSRLPSHFLGAGKKYRVLVVDPPWNQGKTGKRKARPNQSQTLDYPTMDKDDLLGLPIPDWAEDQSLLWLWATNSKDRSTKEPVLVTAFDLMNSGIPSFSKPRATREL